MSTSSAEKTLRCIRCGFCLDACPTFRLTGNEANSPRGRIYLMRSVLEGTLQIDPGVVSHIDSCLGCRACETACPSGVEYANILEDFRSRIESDGHRPGIQKFARKQLLDMLTQPKRMALALKLGRFAGPKDNLPSFVAEALTGKKGLKVPVPATPKKLEVGRLDDVTEAIGERKHTVVVLQGCVMRLMFHPTNLATVRVLQHAGCRVLAPAQSGCCGALHLHTGFHADALTRARAFVDSLEGIQYDALVVNSAGCGSTLKEYGDLLADEPSYAERAIALAAKVKDICEWLVEIDAPTPTIPFPAKVAYHDACHLAHGQKITAQPRALLAAVPGLELVDLPESDTCCGSAGVYNLTQPEMAGRLLERKMDFIQATGASIVATGNPGCLAWIEQGAKQRGLSISIKHPVEILSAAYGEPRT